MCHEHYEGRCVLRDALSCPKGWHLTEAEIQALHIEVEESETEEKEPDKKDGATLARQETTLETQKEKDLAPYGEQPVTKTHKKKAREKEERSTAKCSQKEGSSIEPASEPATKTDRTTKEKTEKRPS